MDEKKSFWQQDIPLSEEKDILRIFVAPSFLFSPCCSTFMGIYKGPAEYAEQLLFFDTNGPNSKEKA